MNWVLTIAGTFGACYILQLHGFKWWEAWLLVFSLELAILPWSQVFWARKKMKAERDAG